VRCPALTLLAALCCGCSFLHTELGSDADLAVVEGFEPGRTRRADVLAALGPPLALAPHGGVVAFLYEHVELEERQFGLNLEGIGAWLGFRNAGLIKVALGRTSSRREAALLLFDGDGALISAEHRSWGETLGKGAGVQLFFAVAPVVDYGSVRDRPRALTWGRELLDPIPVQLNRAHRQDLWLRGTPGHAGQETLDMQSWSQPKRKR